MSKKRKGLIPAYDDWVQVIFELDDKRFKVLSMDKLKQLSEDELIFQVSDIASWFRWLDHTEKSEVLKKYHYLVIELLNRGWSNLPDSCFLPAEYMPTYFYTRHIIEAIPAYQKFFWEDLGCLEQELLEYERMILSATKPSEQELKSQFEKCKVYFVKFGVFFEGKFDQVYKGL